MKPPLDEVNRRLSISWRNAVIRLSLTIIVGLVAGATLSNIFAPSLPGSPWIWRGLGAAGFAIGLVVTSPDRRLPPRRWTPADEAKLGELLRRKQPPEH